MRGARAEVASTLAARSRKGVPRPPHAKPPNPVKPGEVRNPKGINGWTAARERVRDALAANADDLFKTAQRLAAAGDAPALKLLLGPLLPAVETKAELTGDLTVRFAREGEKTGATQK